MKKRMTWVLVLAVVGLSAGAAFGQFAKTEGRRYKRFLEAYGPRCWELEAVDTEVLCGIVESAFRRVIDLDLFHREVERERLEKLELDQHRREVMELLAGV